MRYPRLNPHKVAVILNSAAEGKTYKQIGEDAEVYAGSAFRVVQDFPLWAWYKARRKPVDASK